MTNTYVAASRSMDVEELELVVAQKQKILNAFARIGSICRFNRQPDIFKLSLK